MPTEHTEEERAEVKAQMDKYFDKMPQQIEDEGYWTFDTRLKDADHPKGSYVEHLGKTIEGKFRVLYSGSDGEEASRVVYATGGIPYTLIDDEQGGWIYDKGWRWVNNLGKYIVLLPKNAPKWKPSNLRRE
jgi:hypothetical protein